MIHIHISNFDFMFKIWPSSAGAERAGGRGRLAELGKSTNGMSGVERRDRHPANNS